MPYKDPQKRADIRSIYYQKNKARIMAQHSDWRARNKDRVAAYHADYYRRNKDRIAAYREDNKEHISARHAAYRVRNKDHISARQTKTYEELRARFYDEYGLKKEGHEHGVCTCCKERDLVMFGTVSHIDGTGGQHRKVAGGSLYRILKEALAAYDPTKFAAECWCCNQAAEKYGRDAVMAYFDEVRFRSV